MVRDPSIVSPSLAGVFIGGGHNKHGTGSSRGARCQSSVVPSLPDGDGGVTDRARAPLHRSTTEAHRHAPDVELYSSTALQSALHSISSTPSLLGCTRFSSRTHPVCYPFLFSLQHPLFSSLLVFSRENSVEIVKFLGSEPSLRLVWAQNQPNFRPNRQNAGNFAENV